MDDQKYEFNLQQQKEIFVFFPASCPLGTGALFRCMKLIILLLLVLRLKMH
jgi:hypothetical protein